MIMFQEISGNQYIRTEVNQLIIYFGNVQKYRVFCMIAVDLGKMINNCLYERATYKQ